MFESESGVRILFGRPGVGDRGVGLGGYVRGPGRGMDEDCCRFGRLYGSTYFVNLSCIFRNVHEIVKIHPDF